MMGFLRGGAVGSPDPLSRRMAVRMGGEREEEEQPPAEEVKCDGRRRAATGILLCSVDA
jgi:hypothetical protein